MSTEWDSDGAWENCPDIAGLLEKKRQEEETSTANVGAFPVPLGKPLRKQTPAPVIPAAANDEDSVHADVLKYLKGQW